MICGIWNYIQNSINHQKKSCSNSFHKRDKIEPQDAAVWFSRVNRWSKSVHFAGSLRLTQIELARKFYTVGKLWMSSFKCRKWHLILTFVQRFIHRQRTPGRLTWVAFPVFFLSSKLKFYPTNWNDFWKTISAHTIQHITSILAAI